MNLHLNQFSTKSLRMKLVFTFTFSFIVFAFTSFANNSPLWLRYSSISPDGQNIAFSYKGDLYLVPSSGGEAKLLTFHEAYDFRPIWSPDSKTIAFASDRFGNADIYKISVEGGKATRLTFFSRGEYPTSFTPDGKHILFSSVIMDDPNNVEFPNGSLDELYMISVDGGREKQVLSTPARYANFDSEGKVIIYHDNKGMENTWRKHNTQGFARDIWTYNKETKEHRKLTTFKGDDRWPVFSSDDSEVYYLSEQFGSMNVCNFPIANPTQITQISTFKNHPVRFLTIADNGMLCYGYDGEIYTQGPNAQAQKVAIQINHDDKYNNDKFMTLSSGATEMSVSPSGKEIAFVVRGEVFVTAVEYGTTKRITNTPEQERTVSFSPDGRSLVYASERNGSWNLYQTKIVNDAELSFVSSSLLKETPLLEIPEECFQPSYSPDGNEVAFLEERVILKVINLKTKQIRTILKGDYQYSYTDGDQHYQWSPDGNWFLVDFTEKPRWPMTDVILVDAKGENKIINLTESGYGDGNAKWMMGGKMMIWNTDRNGFRSHGSWGSDSDIYGLFFTQKAFDRFNLSKEELEVLKEIEKKEKEAKKKEESKDKDKKGKKSKKEDAKKAIKALKFDWRNLEDRKKRLTIHSSNISDAILTKDGEKLYYLSRFEGGFDLWVNDLRKKQTSLVTKLKGFGGAMHFDKEGKNLFLMSGGRIIKINTSTKKQKSVSYRAEFNLDQLSEKEYLFEHIWRQVKKKFYDEGMHGIDWDFYKKEYAKFIPYINNNYDYAEMLSELLGELNASHTGSGYRSTNRNGDQTASFGAFYDSSYEWDGIKIQEVIQKGSFDTDKSIVRAGDIIEKINGTQLMANESYYPLLNHQAGKTILVSIYRPETNERWDEYVKAIGSRQLGQILYERWVKIRIKQTEELSGGRIGYVHVRSMSSDSYRSIYSDLLGRNFNKEAIIIDTRFNGGGWLHNDLATLLSGKAYMKFQGRGTAEIMGGEPLDRWYKPSAVIVNEGNYSDAHTFPFAYRANKIGPIIGMPVPGTSTSVWWETLQDRSLYFGIPQVKNSNMDGVALENFEIVPDYMIDNLPGIAVTGRDQQLEKTVEVLLKQLNEK